MQACLYGIIIIISYFLKVLLCPRLNWVNYYKLEQPFRIQDSYARPLTNKQTYNQGDQSFISI